MHVKEREGCPSSQRSIVFFWVTALTGPARREMTPMAKFVVTNRVPTAHRPSPDATGA
jgi:hypothetical protein